MLKQLMPAWFVRQAGCHCLCMRKTGSTHQAGAAKYMTKNNKTASLVDDFPLNVPILPVAMQQRAIHEQ